ncbi:hypothetical protein pipiens_011459, partial [Culex pipiens pipiens]
QIYTPTWLNHY